MSEVKLIKRDDYKAVKRMDREQMSAYLKRIYMRGYEAGCKATAQTKQTCDVSKINKTD